MLTGFSFLTNKSGTIAEIINSGTKVLNTMTSVIGDTLIMSRPLSAGLFKNTDRFLAR